MSSIGEALQRLEEALFVGRELEIAVFRQWLAGSRPTPENLSVDGPAGVGKSTLLRAFSRIAQEQDVVALTIDGQHLPATPEALLQALGGGTREHVLERLNGRRSLLLFDRFEQLLGLSRFCRTVSLSAASPARPQPGRCLRSDVTPSIHVRQQ